jgi:transcriptional regulator with XRE-family HTH domain
MIVRPTPRALLRDKLCGMARLSDPLLRLLRDLAKKKGMNTAAIAVETGIDRTRLKHALGGSEPMTVDELLLVANALQFDARTLGINAPDEPEDPPPIRRGGKKRPLADAESTDDDSRPSIVPEGNSPLTVYADGIHAEQALRVGFGLGWDMFLWLDSSKLAESGVPSDVIESQGETLRIRLEAHYHRHNRPVFHHDHLEIVLSFGTTLHTARFPWGSFEKVALNPLVPEPDLPADDPAPKGPGRAHLRLIE